MKTLIVCLWLVLAGVAYGGEWTASGNPMSEPLHIIPQEYVYLIEVFDKNHKIVFYIDKDCRIVGSDNRLIGKLTKK